MCLLGMGLICMYINMKKQLIVIPIIFVALLMLANYIPSNSSSLRGDYRTLNGLAITATSTTLTSATSVFSLSDVGKKIIVYGAGTSSDGFLGDELITTITGYTSGTQVTLANAATVTVSSANGGFGTDNAPKLESLINDNTVVEFPATGNYLFVDSMLFDSIENVRLIGNGATLSFISSRPNTYPSPGEPERHLFNLIRCDDWYFTDFFAVNIGQNQSLVDTLNEYGYSSFLNNTTVTYNRWWNKNANTGAFVQQQNTRNTILDNIRTYRTGALLQTTSSGSYGGKIRNCTVDGFGFVCITPADGMEITNNSFDNTASPPILSAESTTSTSHMIYSNAGNGEVLIQGNTIKGCRGTAIQWNTGAGNSNAGNRVSNNRFIDCARAGSLIGTNTELQITFTGNTYINTGNWTVNNATGVFTYSNESWIGDYTYNEDFIGAFTLNNAKSIIISNCIFQDVGTTGDNAVINFSGHVTNGMNLLIEGCTFDTLTNKSFRVITDHNLFTGKVKLKDCDFFSQVALGLGASSTVTADGRKKFFIENCSFRGTSASQLLLKFGATLVNNTHYLSSTNSGLEIDLKTNAGNVDIIDCTWIDHSTGTAITLTSAAANNNTVNLVKCTFFGTSALTTNGNTWRRKAGNYFESSALFDALPL